MGHRIKTMMGAAFGAALLAGTALAGPAPGGHVDRIFVGGVLWTGDDAKPRAEAMAVSGDTLVAVGSDAEIRALAKPDTAVVDLKGRFVTPGFQDSHLHFPGPSIYEVQLGDVETLAVFQSRLAAFAKANPDLPWIVGHGWGYSIFPGQSPDKKYIDAVIPDRPVYLSARDGHMGLANSAALKVAGVTAATKDPPNGHIMKHASGEPIGEFKEAAQDLIQSKIPAESDDIRYRSFLANMDKAAAVGLTSVHDAMTSLDNIPLYRRAASAGLMKLRFNFAPPLIPGQGASPPKHYMDRPMTEADLAEYVKLRDELRGPILQLRSVKGALDGTVDAQTATMFDPYVGTNNKGIPFWEQAELNQVVALYDKLGFQVLLHGIGDRAVSEALNAFEYAGKINGTTGRRHRVEHAEVPRLSELKRFKDLGVIASTQAMFANPDETVLKNFDPLLGPKRAPHADSFKIFDDAGIVQAFGSDWNVFDFDPIKGISVAVTRMTAEGKPPGGWYPAGRISVDAALRHYTRDGAYATFDEQERGTLTPGKLADFVVLSQDMTKVAPTAIKDTKVLLTVMGGKDTYRSPGF
jgi:predicted amidohydrolase YtcJ